ncbi:hypothetical protein LINPERHAP1_LOCUS22112 [Linum perenne]
MMQQSFMDGFSVLIVNLQVRPLSTRFEGDGLIWFFLIMKYFLSILCWKIYCCSVNGYSLIFI